MTLVTHWKHGFFALIVAGVLLPVASHAASLRAQLDRSTIALGQTATLSLIFEDALLNAAPQLPQFDADLSVSYMGMSTSQSFNNGAQTTQRAFSYQVVPRAEGEYRIPSLSVTVNGERLTSMELTLTVKPAGSEGTGPEAGAPAKLELEVPKSEVYVGELFPVTVRLYYVSAQNINAPTFDSPGFIFSDDMPNEQGQVSINGMAYRVYTFHRWAKAVRAGQIEFGPVACDAVIAVRNRTVRTIFGGAYEYEQRRLVSNSVSMHVLPLPDSNVPETFNGAIGEFQMVMNVLPKAVAVGDPVTVNVRIGGSGNLDSFELAAPGSWREFETYPPTSKVEFSDNLGMRGIKTFEQILVPQNAEVREVPEFSFSYFDPGRKQYVTLTQEAVPIKVDPAASAQIQPAVLAPQSGEQPPERATDIVHIKPRPGPLAQVPTPLVQTPRFIIVQLVPVFLWIAALLWRKNKERIAGNPRLVRRRETEKKVRESLSKLSSLANEGRSDEFVALVFRTLQEQIGERLDMPASAITESVLDERLKPAGASDELVSRLHELFQICNQARFAPIGTEQQLSEIASETEAAITELKRIS